MLIMVDFLHSCSSTRQILFCTDATMVKKWQQQISKFLSTYYRIDSYTDIINV